MLYQIFDWECFNYDLYFLPSVGYRRGPDPRPLQDGNYISVLGTAHSFGRFAHNPFPQRLTDEYQMPTIDLSTSSIGPRHYIDRPEILKWVNKSAVCVLQAPAARSCGNSEYDNPDYGNNVFRKRKSSQTSDTIHESEIYPSLWQNGAIEHAKLLLKESCETWIIEMTTLINMIDVPIILLWFSSRNPDFEQLEKSYETFSGEFPQLVDEKMIKSLIDKVDHTVYCVSRNGLPIKFKNRFLNKEGYCHFPNISRSSHGYYPSDNMHSECAELLAPILKQYLRINTKERSSNSYPSFATLRNTGFLNDSKTKFYSIIKTLYLENFVSKIEIRGTPNFKYSHLLQMLFSSKKSNKLNQHGTLLLIDEKELLQLEKVDMLKICCIKIGKSINKLDLDFSSKLVELEQIPLLVVDDILVTSESINKTEVAQIFSQLLNPKLDPTFTVIGNSNLIGNIPVYAARNPLLPPNSEERKNILGLK